MQKMRSSIRSSYSCPGLLLVRKQENDIFEYIEFKINKSRGEDILDQEKYVNSRDGTRNKPGEEE